ncbi:MAG: SH3 domain-containing protein, partial [Bacteroidota bacterium]
EDPQPEQMTLQMWHREAENYTYTGKIYDKDGYTNVRDSASADGEIVGKVYLGEEFYFNYGETNWVEVLTREGVKGYMHDSRVVKQ